MKLQPLAFGFLGALLAIISVNAPRAYAQAMSTGGISTTEILAALLGQDVSATRYSASASSGVGYKCDSALASCIDLGPGTKNTIGTNEAGEILISDGVSGAAIVRIGELTLTGNGLVQSAGTLQCFNNCSLKNNAGKPLLVDDTMGFKIEPKALGTCNAASEWRELPDILSGASTGIVGRKCSCRSDGAGNYAWLNTDTNTVGTSTTCPN